MKKEIIVNSSPNEVRVALLEDGEVVEFSMERAESRRAVGNVYKGVVTAVRPGLQAAFVEIGMEKAGFLHVSDLIHDDPEDDDDGARGGRRRRRSRREGLRPIETMLKEGDELLVQVTKEIIGTKGPRLTADVSLPGRFMVLMPKGDHVGVSRKIEDRKERHRLRDLLSSMKPEDEGGAFIIRTAAVGIEPKMLQRDMEYLRDLWKSIQATAHSTQAPAVVHQDVGLLVGMIRDIFKDDIDGLVVDSRDEYSELMQHVRNFSPELRERIKLYEGDVPLFDKFGIEQELKKSLERKVWMKRGGFLVIDEAEALVAIDVNTGRYTGRKNQAETIFKTNMLAAREIARQLRLRDVGGIIVCDFIDMDAEEDKRKVLNELRTHLKRDRARTKTFPVTDLGLVEMSRQRVQQSLKDRLSDDCPYCGGGGQVLSTDTLANKVERLLLKLAATGNEKAVQVRANPTLALVLMTDRANGIQNIARSTGIRVDVVDDPRLHREQFQIVSLHRRKDLVAEIEKAAGEHRDEGLQARREEPPRRRRRDEDAGDRGESGDRGERGERGERGGRRRRRRRDEEDSGGQQERRPSRRTADSQDAGERPSRRRRGDAEERPRRERRAEEPNEEVTTTPAGTGDHPADDDEGTHRRRRRRGRRGGRGRRRRREGEDGETAAEEQGATVTREASAAAVVADEARTEPVRRNEPAQEDASTEPELAAEASGEDVGGDDERRRRGRRRGSRGRSRGAAESETSAANVSDDTSPEPETERVSASTPEPLDEGPNGAAPAEAAETQERRRSRRPRRSRREGAPAAGSAPAAEPVASEPPAGPEPVAGREERPARKAPAEPYVKPVPEEEWMAQKKEAEMTSVTQESLSPPPAEPSARSESPVQDESGDRQHRPRRRRQRRSGTPTRLIGTGKSADDED
jgi:ribonuclease G